MCDFSYKTEYPRFAARDTDYIQNGIKTDTFWLTVSNDGDFAFGLNLFGFFFRLVLVNLADYDEFGGITVEPGGTIETNNTHYEWR